VTLTIRKGAQDGDSRDEIRKTEMKTKLDGLGTAMKSLRPEGLSYRSGIELLGHGEVEIEDYVYVAAGIVGRERGEVIDAEEGALGGVVHGTIAAGFRDADIFNGAVAIDAEGNRSFGFAGSANGGIDGVLHPVLIDGALHGFDVPTVTAGEITAAGTLHGDTTIGGTGEIAEAGRQARLAAFAVGDGVFSLRRFTLENLGGLRGGQGLFFFKFVNVDGVFFGFGRGLGLFLVETFGGVDGAAIGRSDGGLRHGNASAADESDLRAGITTTATDAAPGIAAALDPDADEEKCGKRDVEPGRVTEEAVEGEVVDGVGGVRHGVRTAAREKLALKTERGQRPATSDWEESGEWLVASGKPGREKRNSKSETRKAKSEIRKAGWEARRSDCAAIPPLRHGIGRRCSGRDDRKRREIHRTKGVRWKTVPRFADSARNDGHV